MPRPRTDRKDSKNVFGRRLRKMREAAGWSQSMLAGKAGVSQVLVSVLESGTKQPGWDTVQALSDALEVSTEDFRGK
jgi:transcriptional regulator with XRE-family HTH domain